MTGERWLTAGTIGLLIGLLVTVTWATRHAQRENIWLTDQMRTDAGVISQLKAANATLLDRLDEKPKEVVVEKIQTIVEPCRSVPVFSRDSQFSAK